MIKVFQSYKKNKFRSLEAEQDDKALLLEDYEKDLKDALLKLEDDLMEVEMMLQDALITSSEKFKELRGTASAK